MQVNPRVRCVSRFAVDCRIIMCRYEKQGMTTAGIQDELKRKTAETLQVHKE